MPLRAVVMTEFVSVVSLHVGGHCNEHLGAMALGWQCMGPASFEEWSGSISWWSKTRCWQQFGSTKSPDLFAWEKKNRSCLLQMVSCWFKVCGPFSVPLNTFSSLSSVCIFCGLQNRENLSLSYVFHLILQLGGLLLPPQEEVHKNFVWAHLGLEFQKPNLSKVLLLCFQFASNFKQGIRLSL